MVLQVEKNSSTSSFKRLPGAFIVTTLMIIATGLYLAKPKSVDYSSYMAAIIDKTDAFESVETPRIVFMGGSNLAFGLDCRKIRDALGMRVVNSGLHAGLGLKFMSEQIIEHAKPGDIIVLCPEYQQFYGNRLYGRGNFLMRTLCLYPQSIRYLTSFGQFEELIKGAPVYLKNNLQNIMRSKDNLNTVYNRYAFNEFGDVQSHHEKDSELTESNIRIHMLKEDEINENTLDVLNGLETHLSGMGIKAYYLFPCIPKVWHKRNVEKIGQIYTRLQSDLKMTMIGTPGEFVYPNHFFFDTIYHLDKEGTEKRTLQVIDLMKKALNQ